MRDSALDESTARDALLKVVRGEAVPSDTLEMLRTLRLSSMKALLVDIDQLPTPPEDLPTYVVYLPRADGTESYTIDKPPTSGETITLDSGKRALVVEIDRASGALPIIYARLLEDTNA